MFWNDYDIKFVTFADFNVNTVELQLSELRIFETLIILITYRKKNVDRNILWFKKYWLLCIFFISLMYYVPIFFI